jgi:catechol 2,3-dioxygenase-like lactoylglutathione lyase family enzyme
MGLPNGIHHLALATRDVKAQLDFFTEVIGAELVALYWMHGVEKTVHAFVKLSETSTIAFVEAPEMADIKPEIGVSHPGFVTGPVAPGAMQHVAMNVDSEADLMAMRDRLRAHGHWVMGPLDHGFCKSIYFAGPEGLMLEFSTWTGLDTDEWIDPEVVDHCKLTDADIARYRRPPSFVSRGGALQNPAPNRPGFEMIFQPEMQKFGDALLKMSDAEVDEAMSMPTPPVPKRKVAASG